VTIGPSLPYDLKYRLSKTILKEFFTQYQ